MDGSIDVFDEELLTLEKKGKNIFEYECLTIGWFHNFPLGWNSLL